MIERKIEYSEDGKTAKREKVNLDRLNEIFTKLDFEKEGSYFIISLKDTYVQFASAYNHFLVEEIMLDEEQGKIATKTVNKEEALKDIKVLFNNDNVELDDSYRVERI